MRLPDSSQAIPTQLHGWPRPPPPQEVRRDWLWLSRLAFHLRRASVSFHSFPTSSLAAAVAATKEVDEEEAKAVKWNKEINTTARLNKTPMTVDSFLSNKVVISLVVIDFRET